MKVFSPIPLRTLAPNAITASALSFGLCSAVLSLTGGDLRIAAWFILLSMLLDKLDGSVARAVRGQSEFGVQFDSFADNIAFGVAPAALVYQVSGSVAPAIWGSSGHALGVSGHCLLAAICLFYAMLTTVRLARFNVTTTDIGPYVFQGLPSTMSGGVVACSYLALGDLKALTPEILQWFPVVLAVLALLMVSNLPLPKLKFSTGSMPARIFKISGAVIVYGAVLARTGYVAVTILIFGYMVVGFGWLGPRLMGPERSAH